jgi:hypothetical protein
MKAAFMQGQLNVVQCPQCGSVSSPDIPILYYDLEKEIAFIFAPSALHLDSTQQEKAIGQMTNSLVNSLPAEERKFYLLNPKRFLTLESMVKAILQADGITEEMMEAQQTRAKLLEEILKSPDEATLKAKAKEHDAELDYEFFEMLTALIQTSQMQGNVEQSQVLFTIRELLARWTTQGRKAITEIDEKIGMVVVENQEELLEKMLAAENDEELETLVTAGHQLLDYGFFQKLTAEIDRATKEGAPDKAKKLTELRNTVLEMKENLETQSKEALENAAKLLQEVVKSGRPDKVLAEKLDEIDDAFFYILSANIEEAKRQKQKQAVQAMEMIGGMAMAMLQERYGPPPEAEENAAESEAEPPEEKPQILTAKR